MKISLDMIYWKLACRKAKLLYHKLNLQDIDLNNKEITIYDEESNIEYLQWLANTFNLNLNILYKEYDDEIRDIYVFKNGLCTSYTTLGLFENDGFIEWNTYNDYGLLTYSENTNGDKEFYTYDDNGNKLSYENSNGYAEVYIRDDTGLLLRYEDTSNIHRTFTYNTRRLLTSFISDSYREYRIYNDKGLLIKKNMNGVDAIYTYDNNDLLINYKFGQENKTFVYENKLLKSFTFSNGVTGCYKYDNNGIILSYEDSTNYKEIFTDGLLTSIKSNYEFSKDGLRYDIKEINENIS